MMIEATLEILPGLTKEKYSLALSIAGCFAGNRSDADYIYSICTPYQEPASNPGPLFWICLCRNQKLAFVFWQQHLYLYCRCSQNYGIVQVC